MNSFLLALALTCPKTIMINHTTYPWNSNDTWNLNTAYKGCKRIFVNSPCVKKFIKSGKQDYQVVCGKETK